MAEKMSRRSFLKLLWEASKYWLAFSLLDRWPPIESEPKGKPVLGLHLPFYPIASEKVLRKFTDLVLTCGANTIVVDIKNEDGLINLPLNHPLLPKGAIQDVYVKNLESFLLWAEAHDIFLIARQVVMIDPKLVLAHPNLGLHSLTGLWKDANDLPWANPYADEVVDYNTFIAVAAAQLGFRRVQFDYVRFPSDNTEEVIYTRRNTLENRTAAISAFFKRAKAGVNASGAQLTADFFGYTAWEYQQDMGIGQSIESAGPYLDGICPMAYPGLYGGGIIDSCENRCRPPTAHPYEIVYFTVAHTLERLKLVNPHAFVTPWIQAYPDVRFGQAMGLKQLQLQQQAAFDAGATGVMAWNPSLKYDPKTFLDIS